LLIGDLTNDAGTDPTKLTAIRDTDAVFAVDNGSVVGAKTGVAVHGHAGEGAGVMGTSDTSVGAYAVVGDATAAQVSPNTDYTGVYGFVDGTGVPPGFFATGVWGDSFSGEGVFGSGSIGVAGVGGFGVAGFSDVPGGIGVLADSTAPAIALHVNGKAHFSRSGKASVGRTRTYVSVSVPGATGASMVLATIQANKLGLYVKGAVATTNRITIYLSKKPPVTVKVAWIVLD
jgi:hypothetical protein